ncbi:MAG: DUF3795 domain-containing protein [Thermoplasmatales archaeon]|nr:MAG: DUF3795 domain-containing protein [Thermoplasmatales archaeon]
MSVSFKQKLIAPCGMDCRICIGYFGYMMSDKKRKNCCIGCRPRNNQCAFLKEDCKKLTNEEIKYCFECEDFPCENLKKLDKRYTTKYEMSMIENLKYIEKNGISKFIENEMERWKCPKCGGVICVHNRKCYNCGI